MELHQLQCFIAVAEEGGFNRASARLRMTQPAISYQVKQLEKELGQPLFYRRPRGISTTEAGRVLFHHARQLIEQVRRTRHAIERLSGGVTGEVRIGTVNSVGMYILPGVLQMMRTRYPEARPTLLYRHSYEILEALLSNQVDMAIVANPPPDRRFGYDTLLVEKVTMVCGRSHPFFGRTTVDVEDLKKANFVSLTDENPTGKLARDYLARHGVVGEPVVSTDNVETVKKMVEVGLGVALLPNMVTQDHIASGLRLAGRLARIEIPPPALTRDIVLVTWKQLELSPAAVAFISLLREQCAEWENRDESGAAPPGDEEIEQP
ncbi:MAG: LysR family transcriptional regulator [Planctomycetota bacterium]